MTMINTIIKSTVALGAFALATSAPKAADAFTPVEPPVLLGGAAGFTDLYVLSAEGREDCFDDVSAQGESSFFCKEVSSQIGDGVLPVNDRLFTNDGFRDTDLDFPVITVNELGQIDGIATVTVNGQEVELPVIGRSVFREVVTREYTSNDFETAGFENGIPPFPSEQNLRRNINHTITVRGARQGYSYSLALRSRAFEPRNQQIKESYSPTPNILRGTLKTRTPFTGRTGVAIIETIGAIESAVTFRFPRTNMSATSTFSRFFGGSELNLPNEFTSAIVSAGGRSVYAYKFFNLDRNRPGTYSLSHRNTFNRRGYTVASKGFFLNTQQEVALVGTGAISFDDLSHRDRSFSLRTPAAVTVVRSVYTDPEVSLSRFDSND